MPRSPEDLGRFFAQHKWQLKRCLAPGLSCQNPAIRAHSIQNARVIDLLEDGGKVVAPTVRFDANGPKLRFAEIGRRNASTFLGLCSDHDRELFLEIDRQSFDPENPKHVFQLAYRSVTRELHVSMEGASKIQSAYLSRVERGLDPVDASSPAGMEAVRQIMKAYSTYNFRSKLDKQFIGADHVLESDTIRIKTAQPTIAVSSMFSLDKFCEPGEYIPVVLNVFPLDHQNSIAVFSYYREHAAVARKELSPVLSANGEYQKFQLSKLIIVRIENFLLSRRYFSLWPTAKLNAISKAFVDTLFETTEVKDSFELFLF